MFVPRLTKPEKGNPYYTRRVSGGYSRAIKGSPTDPDCDVLHNCVGYAYGRFHEIAEDPGMSLLDPVNAENLYQNARSHGLPTGQKPRAGALIVWQKGATLSGSDGAGHVAVVEAVNSDGSIVTSESGWGAKLPFWTTKRTNSDGNWNGGTGYMLLGFVYQPDGMPRQVLRKGDSGDAVIRMQTRLWERGYLRKTEIDGEFGRITLGAVLAFQLESGLETDGICGPLTAAALFG